MEYSGYISTQQIRRKTEVFNAADYRRLISEGKIGASHDYGGNTDWFDEISRTPFIHNHNVSIRGGSRQTNYLAALTYNNNVFVTENQNSFEIIFGLAVDANYTTGWNAFDHHMQTLPSGLQYKYNITMEPWGGMCAIPQFINTFDPDDSRYHTNFIYGPQYTMAGAPILITSGSAEYIGKPMDFVNEVNRGHQ